MTDDSGASDFESSEVEPAVTRGELLARVDLTDTHYVEFWENLPGDLTVIEAFHADRDTGAVASDFDPSKRSVAAFYKELAGPAAKPETYQVLLDFEERAVPLGMVKVESPTAERPAEVVEALVDKGTEPPGWNFLNEFAWFSSNFCRIDTSNDVCFINMESVNDVRVANAVRGVLFNQDFSLNATMRINFDPCYNKPFFVFCSDPFKGLQKLSLAPRTVLSSSTWSNKNRYQVFAEGRHIGVFIDWR